MAAEGASRDAAPVLPDYTGACVSQVVPALIHQVTPGAWPGWPRPDGSDVSPAPGVMTAPAWMPAPVLEARQVVLFVIDGLGWAELQEKSAMAPTLSAMAGGVITSVAPTTTATALTSIVTGSPPAEHGIVSYRMYAGNDRVLNILRWRTQDGDATEILPPAGFQLRPAFGGTRAPAVTRSEFETTGFTVAHLGGARLHGWRVPSTLVVEVRRLLAAGETFVYAYYDGIDRVAHDHGLGEYYDAELAATDALVADIAGVLPRDAVLVVTADHGQVPVDGNVVVLDPGLLDAVRLLSGEGRFRWLHARAGAEDELFAGATALYGYTAWVRSAEQLEEEGWFGGPLSPVVRARLGDVAVIARDRVAFLDPADVGASKLVCRHGSVTAEEMHVPLLASGR